MIDLYHDKNIDERVDIWALGVTLFMMCFWEHPFDENRLGILNGSYTIPDEPKFSSGLIQIIRTAFF